MSTLSCRFCAHRNPPGAKFCSDCGSPLELKPCPKCEAVNDVGALLCHQCGARFDAAPATDAAAQDPNPFQPTSDLDDRAGARGVPQQSAPQESVHIPESLAERLGGQGTARSNYMKVEPRVPVALDGNPGGAEADDDPPIALRSYAVSSSRGPFRGVTLAVALISIGVAGYYVYTGRISEVLQDRDVALAGKSTPESAPPAGSNSAPATAQSETMKPPPAEPATSASEAMSPAEAVNSQPATVQPQPASAQPQPEPAELRAETVKSRKEPAARTRKPPGPSALATQRLIARDLGRDADAPGGPATPLDKDAIETQRLIERELGPFLPDKANGTSRDTLPAIN